MSYEEEYKQIEDWYWKERDEINKIPSSGGLDGPAMSKGAALNRELTVKLNDLKTKYNIK